MQYYEILKSFRGVLKTLKDEDKVLVQVRDIRTLTMRLDAMYDDLGNQKKINKRLAERVEKQNYAQHRSLDEFV